MTAVIQAASSLNPFAAVLAAAVGELRTLRGGVER
jgi:uncharacterized ion transporter superfamily protein YfcC